jgi:hypothetical protein
MHIWHHSKKCQTNIVRISLSVIIFKTNYIPKDGRDIELGFDENEFPHDFIKQGFIP